MPSPRRLPVEHPDNAPLWAVTHQEQDPSYATDGVNAPDWLVYYRTRHGVEGHIRVPAALYTPQYVAGQLDKLGQVHDEIARLQAGEHPGR